MSNNSLSRESICPQNKDIASYTPAGHEGLGKLSHLRGFSVFLFTPIFVGLLISSAWGQSLNSVLSKLDQNYYYPQKQGLKSLSARVQWEQLDVASGSGRFLRNPNFNFTWRADSFGLGNFELAAGQEHISKDRFKEVVQKIRPFRESIIPLTLKQKFSDFQGWVDEMDGGKLIVKLTSKIDSQQSYKLLVDSKAWVIRKLRFQQLHTPQRVEGEFRYTKLDGKLAISESRIRFEIDGQEYNEVTSYKYKKVRGVWWVHRIEQTYKEEDHIVQTYVLRLSDFKPLLSSDQ